MVGKAGPHGVHEIDSDGLAVTHQPIRADGILVAVVVVAIERHGLLL
jgi:hypothetical protein